MPVLEEGEVAKTVVTPTSRQAAVNRLMIERRFIFIIAQILSSVRLCLKLLYKGESPLFCSSRSIKVIA